MTVTLVLSLRVVVVAAAATVTDVLWVHAEEASLGAGVTRAWSPRAEGVVATVTDVALYQHAEEATAILFLSLSAEVVTVMGHDG